jgi:hypothetical protein
MHIEDINIPNYLDPDDAIVQSRKEGMSHTSWINESTGIIIAVEYSEDHGTAVLIYENLDKYLENFENSWVLEYNSKDYYLENLKFVNG